MSTDGVDELRDAHKQLRAEARRQRREFAQSAEGGFAREMQAAMREFHRVRTDGVSREDAVKGLETVLRAVWPKPTSKFPDACELCQDTGWRPKTCTHEMRCGRRICSIQHPAFEHAFVEPCGCERGDRFRPKGRPTDPESVIAAAARGKTRKRPGGFSRFGGR